MNAAFSVRRVSGMISQINYRGSVTHYIIRLDSGNSITAAGESRALKESDSVHISVNPEKLIRCGN